MTATEIRFEVNGIVDNGALNALYDASWPAHVATDFAPLLPHYLAYVCAYDGTWLIGWVYLAWDGWQHAFLLDPTVHPEYRRLGIGRELVRLAANAARQAGCEVLHVDYAVELAPFYEACGFEPTAAGLIRLK
ncbi:MAG TPA: GNAT family N-acetyltransferase [Dehalococcoidia bacterium]|jgi:GNAT superfamily N-acetyltransferase